MPQDPGRPYVDALDLSAEETRVYEAIAALEYRGLPVRRPEIAATAGLSEPDLDEALARLTERGALLRDGSGDDAEYEPATQA
jgi:hypothetical protein